jgi:hypothetical protein
MIVERAVQPPYGVNLRADEIDALYQQLHRKGQRSIYISCIGQSAPHSLIALINSSSG